MRRLLSVCFVSTEYPSGQNFYFIFSEGRLIARFPRDRVCIKIPATPESILACKELEENGIRTLATCLFSIPQAMAASQAGCLYVAPYFNGRLKDLTPQHSFTGVWSNLLELRVHFPEGASSYIEYKDPVGQHPMSPVIYSIVQAFKEKQASTAVMPAR